MAERAEPGAVLAGRYRLERPIAGALWEGVDIVLSRPVCVRLGLPRTSGTSRFTHPNVVTLFDAGVDEGRHFTVLELVRGDTLRRAMKGMELEHAVAMGIDIARALGAGHLHGVAHGALDADAVLLSPSGRVKLTPFRVPAAHDEDVEADVWAAADLVAEAAGPKAPPELRKALQKVRDHPDAVVLADALGELGIVDDAIDLGALAATPPGGVRTAPRRSRSSAVPGVIVLTMVAVAGAVAFALARSPQDPRPPGGSGRGGGPVTVRSATSFDPLGDGAEHEDEAHLAIDEDDATEWTTSRYATRALGGLKPGVGLVLRLPQSSALTALEIRTPATGWRAQVYVADAPASGLEGWGVPVASTDGGSSAQVFRLGGKRGAAVLLWITDLGDAGPPLRFSVAEAILTR